MSGFYHFVGEARFRRNDQKQKEAVIAGKSKTLCRKFQRPIFLTFFLTLVPWGAQVRKSPQIFFKKQERYFLLRRKEYLPLIINITRRKFSL